ncbi:MAG: hypothetical protein ACRD1T_15960, partial [Acidimicrobiia bacterium]
MDHLNAFVNDQWSIGRATLNLGARFDHYKVYTPEQKQLAFSIFPGCETRTDVICAIPAETFPARTFFTWNSFVPRIGLVYDLTGDGKTVIKTNYGYFKHNPGTSIADSANPNQAAKIITYRWTDLSGDGLFQPGEQGTVISTALAGSVFVADDISQPYTHEASLFLERQLTNDIGARVGFVYKTEDNFWQTYRPLRPISNYTVPFTFVDIGPDGLRNTPDDRPLTFLAIPNALAGPATARSVIQNVPAISRYKTLELSLNKRFTNRWSAGLGFGYTWTRENQDTYRGNTISPSQYKNSPNDTDLHEFTNWGFKLHGTYDGPWDIRLTPLLRHQSGHPYGRILTVSAPSGLFYSGTILVEPLNTRRMDNINIFDVRAEKILRLQGTRLRLFLDVFNIFNSHASE